MNQQPYFERYKRQILLKEFGLEAQLKLKKAQILVIGAGGLGCPAMLYLTAAGAGTIGIVDFDIVDISNLHRQILYTTLDIGKSKVKCAAKRLKALNPEVIFKTFNYLLTTKNILKLFSGFDLIIDGTDNFATRYMINDACVLLDKPLIYGAVLKFEGQVGVFNFSNNDLTYKTNYRDLFPVPPNPENTQSCNEAGVLGVLPGIIGTMQAAEAIKIITGIGLPLCNSIISFNSLTNSFYEFKIKPVDHQNNGIPKNKKEFLSFNYPVFCGSNSEIPEISSEHFNTLLSNEKLTVIDVREDGELPDVTEFKNLKMPLGQIKNFIKNLVTQHKIIVFCQTGKRSLKATKILMEELPGIEVYSLAEGILGWKKSVKI